MKNIINKLLGLNRHYIAVIFVLLFYFISQLSILDKPGMQEDEGIMVAPSMELAYGKEISYGSSFNHFGIHYPLMIGAYTGNNLTIPVAFIIRAFGFHLVLVRLLWVIVSVGVILFTFLVCRELFNDWVGLMASILLAINPSFWMFSHVGAHTQANMLLDIMGSLFFFLIFYRTQKRKYLFLAMFLMGHGVYTKLAFGYFLIAYLISFTYIWIQGKLKKEVFSLQNLFISVIALFSGLWPFLYYAISTRGPLHALKTALTGSSLSGQSNLDIGRNFLIRFNQMWEYLLAGGAPADMILAGISVKHNLIMPYVFWLSFLFLVVLIVWPGQRPFSKGRIAFIVLVLSVYQFLIVFTPSSLNYGVFAFIPPYVTIILALALYLFYQILNSSKFSQLRWLAIMGALLLGYSEMNTLFSQYNAVSDTGGKGVWSSAIFQLNDYLLEHPESNPIGLDWGLGWPIYVLSDLRINPSNAYWPFTIENGAPILWQISPPPDFSDTMSKLIHQPENIYLVRDEKFSSFHGRLAALENVVIASGAELEKIYIIYESNGDEFIDVYKVKWPGD